MWKFGERGEGGGSGVPDCIDFKLVNVGGDVR